LLCASFYEIEAIRLPMCKAMHSILLDDKSSQSHAVRLLSFTFSFMKRNVSVIVEFDSINGIDATSILCRLGNACFAHESVVFAV
jgi:hypothetical protein